jgi:hypothetical protein
MFAILYPPFLPGKAVRHFRISVTNYLAAITQHKKSLKNNN